MIAPSSSSRNNFLVLTVKNYKSVLVLSNFLHFLQFLYIAQNTLSSIVVVLLFLERTCNYWFQESYWHRNPICYTYLKIFKNLTPKTLNLIINYNQTAATKGRFI